jgi:hypothetical protein
MKKILRAYKRFFGESLWRSFFTVWSLRNFAIGLIAVYSPIYFYTVGYGLDFIFLFLAIQAAANGAMRLPYAYVITRTHNIKHSFALSMVLIAFVYAGYALFIDQKSVLLMLAVIDGILQCVLLSCYHYIFNAAQRHKRIGSQVSMMYDGSYMLVIFGIALGGFVGQTIGLAANFLIAAVATAFAAALILKLKITWPHHPKNIKREKVDFKHIWRPSLAGGANIIDAAVVAILWPLSIIVFGLTNFTQLGLLIAGSLLFSILINLIYGGISDDVDRAKILLNSAILGTILANILRIVTFTSALGSIIVLFISQAVRGATDVSFSTLFYRKLNKTRSKIKFISIYESLASAMLALFFLLLWVFVELNLSTKLVLALTFLVAAIVSPLMRYIAQK